MLGETPSFTGQFIGETHGVLEHTQTQPPGNQHQKGPICLWVAGEVTESQPRAEQAALFPLKPLTHMQRHNTSTWVALPCRKLKALLLTTQLAHPDKKMTQMKEQIKAPEKNTTK